MSEKYKIEDINIGDSVYFERNGVSNYDLYWKVVGKFKDMIQVEIDEMGYKDEIYIDASDIVRKEY